MSSSRIVCLGEAMVELTARQGRWDVHYGGDTLNVVGVWRRGERRKFFVEQVKEPQVRLLLATDTSDQRS